jgi:uncharacterized membrane protein SpoIIM required for sporulation
VERIDVFLWTIVEIGLAIDAGKPIGNPLYQSFSGLLSQGLFDMSLIAVAGGVDSRGCRFRTDLFVILPVYLLAYLRAVVGFFTSLYRLGSRFLDLVLPQVSQHGILTDIS